MRAQSKTVPPLVTCVILPPILAVVVPLVAAHGVFRLVLRGVLEVRVAAAGRRVLVVTSDSPVWRDHVAQHWLPRLGDRALVLNGSERATWGCRPPLVAWIFRRWAPQRDCVPLVLVVPRLGRVRHVGFHRAFRDAKHGRTHTLRTAEAEAFRLVDEVAPRPPPSPVRAAPGAR